MRDTINKQAISEFLRLQEKKELIKGNIHAASGYTHTLVEIESGKYDSPSDQGEAFNQLVAVQHTLKQIIGELTPAEFVTEVVQNQEEFRKALDENERLFGEVQRLRAALVEIKRLVTESKGRIWTGVGIIEHVDAALSNQGEETKE